ncbi:acidic leucine-rich nuclear phosphoprotein 32-related protein 2-like [Eurytemora carolleeae]|uniref:acidic leucine-rich nuclear phosphoprotein 32-related protein 2-like n=1 Tax=Eurytemora carolleeae TaxID=1294199 RepID=UPI000C7874D0|nr:acidic leucine-rich nuclear phosphoprotein 32-related protein 2-like [Eurytemora carolleeae]|eukprot:XP_023335622.1 acidic leucine-rich nuclear phosphoprotein 32-related protein 2-like [Eurytemora affinis]
MVYHSANIENHMEGWNGSNPYCIDTPCEEVKKRATSITNKSFIVSGVKHQLNHTPEKEDDEGWEEDDEGWGEDDEGWEEDDEGWREDDKGWEEDDEGREEDDEGWEEDDEGWEEDDEGWEEDDEGWEEERIRQKEVQVVSLSLAVILSVRVLVQMTCKLLPDLQAVVV